ncbi:MAG: peptidoglycan D,D-transpeptidase FtsI family protein [Armatimonadota bacterium]
MLLIICLRLAWWQIGKHTELSKAYANQHIKVVPIPAPRGRILDSEGNELAMNNRCVHLLIQPQRIFAPVMAADVISIVTKIDRAQLLDQFTKHKSSFYILKNALGPKMDRLIAMETIMNQRTRKQREAAIKASFKGTEATQLLQVVEGKKQFTPEEVKTWTAGVIVERDNVRKYPMNQAACQLIGTVDNQGVGRDGIEYKFNPPLDKNGKSTGIGLQGRDGQMQAEFARDGHIVPGTEKDLVKMIPGVDVRLTINSYIQSAAEKALNELAAKHKPKRACAIVMDPNTGEILAMANVPGYDLNKRSQSIRHTADIEKTRNMAASHAFEPGSIFKPITISGGLHSHVITENSQFNCDGNLPLPGKTIHCPHGVKHGQLTPREIIAQSCNVCTGRIALRMGPKTLYNWIVSMGLTKKACRDIPSSSWGYLPNPNLKRSRWGQVANANIGFGQGVTVTPIGLLTSFCSLINGGEYIPAQIIKGKKGKKRRLLTQEESMELRSFLKATVDEGTGPLAQVPGYLVGGKTGTAQRVYETVRGQKRAGTGYEQGAYVTSFVGFAPVNEPRVAILVTVDRPTQNGHYGGTVAGPAFAKIMGESLAHLSVTADPFMKLHPQYHKRKKLND